MTYNLEWREYLLIIVQPQTYWAQDPLRKLQANRTISYFLSIFNAPYMRPKINQCDSKS